MAKDNTGSIAVLKKLGFYVEKEGAFKKRLTDIVYEDYTYRLDLETVCETIKTEDLYRL